MTDSQKTLLRREMGMVFQGSALFDSMTVLENVMFPLKMLTQKDEDEIIEKAENAIKRVELENAQQKLPSELSGGMQKRVAIARAIVMNPKYLFCDEPNSGLDPKTAIIIDNLIQEITKEYNITTIINSHDMNSVMEIGEKIIFLVNGEKNWEGTNKDIFSTENQSITDFVYSSDENRLITVDGDLHIKMWDLPSEKLIHNFDLEGFNMSGEITTTSNLLLTSDDQRKY